MKARKITPREKFFRVANEITSNTQQQPIRTDASFWFLEYVEAENRATQAETELASLRAQIAAGQLVDVRTLPQNISYTFTRQIW